ncbi:MAG: UTP--glucose-1-phosphate uridylyltransferase [Chlamydiota bacterium]|nr:UTP--glucose-1-phosphate uridylyltransferase [Chlamydiota bacterium]
MILLLLLNMTIFSGSFAMQTYNQPPIDYQAAQVKLQNIDQLHLLNYWDSLDSINKDKLLSDIADISPDFLHHQRSLLNKKIDRHDYQKFTNFTFAEDTSCYHHGKELISQGLVGTVVVAGGQGTRFGFKGPKGCFPISNVKEKTLFQIIAEKTLYASKLAKRPLPLAIMTSDCNHKATLQFFEDNAYFGLDANQVSFFKQSVAPMLDVEGNLFLSSPHTIAKGPDGNGAFFNSFVDSGTWQKWTENGIRLLNFILVDNPLGDPFDLDLIGFHAESNNDVTIKCIPRADPEEKVGVIVADNTIVRVIEYSEIDDHDRYARDENGNLAHLCANISLFCMNMDFVKSIATDVNKRLPYHIAFKASDYVDNDGNVKRSKSPIAHKYEKFIFDMLPFSEKIGALIYKREDCFAPLKNRSGNHSPETVKCMLLNADKKQWQTVTGTLPPTETFELSQEFYYPTEEFKKYWESKTPPQTKYID